MSPTDHDRTADDRFEQYFAEKLWAWIPEIYRSLDPRTGGPPPEIGPLRSLIEVLAEQSAIARRSIDRLWEDQFIDSCDDWVVPYLGELVGTRMLTELNKRGRRADVANTIYYRRRKGTPYVLEKLVRDITGWECVLVEGFRTLARTRHGLDAEMGGEARPAVGGTCAIRGRSTATPDDPFALKAHTPDVRMLRGRLGRHNITRLNVHLFQYRSLPLRDVTPMDLGDGRFTFDPSGRDVPLFQRAARDLDELDWHAPEPWQVPRAMTCAALGTYRLELSLATLDALRGAGADAAAVDSLVPYVGRRFASLASLDQFLARVGDAATLRDHIGVFIAFAQHQGSPHQYLVSPNGSLWLRLQGDATGDDEDVAARSASVAAASLASWDDGLDLFPDQPIAVDPARGRFVIANTANLESAPVHQIGAFGEIGAGAYDRRASVRRDAEPFGTGSPLSLPATGVHEIGDSRSYRLETAVADVTELTVQAANFQRPYLFRTGERAAAWGFRGETDESALELDGLWLGARPEDPGAGPVVLALEGTFARVVLRHCTLDPGGPSSSTSAPSADAVDVKPIVLEIRGTVRELRIESSIVGAVREAESGTVDTLFVRDSIIQQLPSAAAPAVALKAGELHAERSTIFGDVRVNRLYATELIGAGPIWVTDNQHGCVRFSATSTEGDLPRQFESHRFPGGIEAHVFVSQRFGDPGYGQLSQSAPSEIVTGAETRSEMGAFCRALAPIKIADINAKLREYMPFGLVPQLIVER